MREMAAKTAFLLVSYRLRVSEDSGGHDRDRTCDPYHVKVVPKHCNDLRPIALC